MTELFATAPRRHFIVVGRVSREIADKLVNRFGRENIIQARFGTHGDGESTFELFVDGKLDDHPLEQNYTSEKKLSIVSELKGAHVSIVHSVSGQNTSSRAMSLMQCLKALKDDWGVETITLIPPHMALTRADRKFERKIVDASGQVVGKEPQFNAPSNLMMAELLGQWANRFVGLDFHSKDSQQQYEEIFSTNYPLLKALRSAFSHAHNLPRSARSDMQSLETLHKLASAKALPNPIFGKKGIEFISAIDQVLTPKLKNIFADAASIYSVVLGAPDGADKPKDAGIERALRGVQSFHGFVRPDFTFEIAKVRISDRETIIDEEKSRAAHVKGKICVLVDDIISSGSTQLKAADYLKRMGAEKVIAYATHGVFINSSMEKILQNPAIDEVWVTDSVPGVVDKLAAMPADLRDKMRILSVADAIVEAVVRDYAARLETAPDLRFIIPERHFNA
jgi:phosphoribosylpyrophosphate synthetase